jgi:hypothetical protein
MNRSLSTLTQVKGIDKKILMRFLCRLGVAHRGRRQAWRLRQLTVQTAAQRADTARVEWLL